jgi:hypothetical protein
VRIPCASGAAVTRSNGWRGWLMRRSGRPPRFSAVQRARAAAIACELPATRDMPSSRWSSFELASEAIEAGIVVDISPATVAPWLATDAIKPWQYRSWSRPAPRLRQQSRRGPRPVRPGPARHTPARIRPRWSAGLPGRLGCAPRAGVRPLRAHHQISTPPPPDPSTGATPPPTSTPPSPACRPRTPLAIAGLQPGGGSRFSPELARGAAHTNRPDRCHARVA